MQTFDSGDHTDDFLETVDSIVKYLYLKFDEFSIMLLPNSV